ncbi:MAG: hypothetical protein DRJ18_00405 [Candidatus Methanomethylicota archaeon]|nr:MAG: hypothetical protein DRJ18_00405 [Candidatus Verstraetearchaeota archaeon]
MSDVCSPENYERLEELKRVINALKGQIDEMEKVGNKEKASSLRELMEKYKEQFEDLAGEMYMAGCFDSETMRKLKKQIFG